ncbi:hypothetical protein I4U23_022516 [Adineta vaga]|nr:hypothetical protein I4U23_022516 [Adineta vaga]
MPSYFVTDDWIRYLKESKSSAGTYIYDFRVTGTYIFQSLNMFCKVINQMISDNLIRFYSTQYITRSVTPDHLFQVQTQTFAQQFRSSLTTSFLLSMAVIRNTTQINNVASVLPGNFVLREPDSDDYMRPYPAFYSNCSCHESAKCKAPLSIYAAGPETELFTIPNFYLGCYPIEALLQSTLECFFDDSCIQQIQTYVRLSSTIQVQSLNSSSLTKYVESSTIKDIIENLMIERWNFYPMYENYYDECKPIQCIYSYETRNDIIYIVTTIFGLIGGLVTVLKFIIPRII